MATKSSAKPPLFDMLGKVSACAVPAGYFMFGRLLTRMTLAADNEMNDSWEQNAEWARLDTAPLRARALLYVIVLVTIALLGWASLATVDEVARGSATVVPSSRVQIVQSVDGGVVDMVAVAEGDVVDADQLLLKVDSTRFLSSMLENRAERLALAAKAQRLEALTQGKALVFSEEIQHDASDIAAHEIRQYRSQKAELAAQTSIAQAQLKQREQGIREAQARYRQASSGMASLQSELNTTRPLVASGAVSKVEVLRLEREYAHLRGERDQAAARIAREHSAIDEARQKLEEVELNSRNQLRDELSRTLARLSSMSEGARSFEDKVKQTEIRAPLRGTVKRVLVNNAGGVVQPGQAVMEIVPLDDTLILEAKIQPQDIAFIHPGQEAMVKFTAYDFAIYGGLLADIEQISADTVLDDRGRAAYIVRLKTRQAQLGENLPIIPGMLADVDIRTGKKTVLSYLLKPVLRATSNALSER